MVLKLVLIGDALVGKTSLRKKFFGFPFKSQYGMTIGGEFSILDTSIVDEKGNRKSSKAQIWDIQPQKKFEKVRSLYYIATHIVILVYDISNPKSFENLPNWIKESQEHTGIVPLVLIGNKKDLRSSNKGSITKETGLDFASRIKKEYLGNKYDVPFIETSAVTEEFQLSKINIDLVFDNEKFTVSLFN